MENKRKIRRWETKKRDLERCNPVSLEPSLFSYARLDSKLLAKR